MTPTDFTFLFIIRVDPSPILFYFYFLIRSELIRPELARTGGPSWSGPTFVPAYLKCSFVQCRQYHTSWWNGAAELHISIDLLCGITAAAELLTLWNNGRRATQLGGFTLWHYGRLATQLSRFTLWHNRRWASRVAGKFTLWHNGRWAKQPGLMHAPGVARIFQRKIWRLYPKSN